MTEKLCKKCQRPLPDGYKYKYCENCRTVRAEKIRNTGKAIGAIILAAGTAAGLAASSKKDD